MGGAISATDYSTLSIKGSTLLKNRAATRVGGFSAGAGMAVGGYAGASVTHSIFASNRAQIAGGGIYLADDGWVSVVRTLFVNDTADLGGAMLLSGNSHATLTAVQLQGNFAVSVGGAVSVSDNCSLTCHQSSFLRNTAGSYGGAIAATSNATFLLRNCSLLSNKGFLAGGALYMGESKAQGNVFAVTAANNTADRGGFAVVSDSAVLNVSGGTFHRNFASPNGRGGALYASAMAQVNLKDCIVSGGVRGPGVVGGAFNIEGNVRLTMSACTIADYNAQFGGGLWAHGNSSVYAHNCIWRNLAAEQSGGGAFLGGVAHSTLHGGRFSSMHAQYGGAIHIMAGSVDVADTAFDNSTSSFHGGALLIDHSAVVNLTNGRFDSCSTDSGGGVAYVGDKAHMLSDNGGGALCINDNAHVNMVGCSISRCTAGGVGGALEVGGNATVIMHIYSLGQNKAKTFGGAVMLGDAVHMVAKYSSFVENICSRMGGALHASNRSKVHLEHCTLAENSAAAGGGLHLSDVHNIIIIICLMKPLWSSIQHILWKILHNHKVAACRWAAAGSS